MHNTLCRCYFLKFLLSRRANTNKRLCQRGAHDVGSTPTTNATATTTIITTIKITTNIERNLTRWQKLKEQSASQQIDRQ